MQLQNYSFLILNIVVLSIPLLANLYFKYGGLKQFFLHFLKTYSIVGVLITFLSSLIIYRADWQFNTKFLTGMKIGNVPIEVVVFFFAIPFASIALYEFINKKYKEKRIILDNSFFYLFSFTYFFLAVVFSTYSYTSNIFILLAVFMLSLSYFRKNNVFLTKNFYIFSVFSILGFILVAAILTSTPFVTYSNTAITGFRIGMIPFEEFFAAFLIVSVYLTVYYLFKNRSDIKTKK